MIDVDDEVLVESRDAGSRQVAAFHHDGRVERPSHLLCDVNVAHAGKFQELRWRGIGGHHLHVLAELAQRERHSDLRADRVAVGPCVRGDDEPLALKNGVADGGDGLSGHQGRARRQVQ